MVGCLILGGVFVFLTTSRHFRCSSHIEHDSADNNDHSTTREGRELREWEPSRDLLSLFQRWSNCWLYRWCLYASLVAAAAAAATAAAVVPASISGLGEVEAAAATVDGMTGTRGGGLPGHILRGKA